MTAISPKFLKLLSDYDQHCNRIAKSTSIDIHETPEAKLKRIRALESDYTAWFEYYFPNYAKVKCAWFHKELAKLIINNKRIRLLAEMFRSAGKSVHIDMGIPMFLYLALGELKFMLLVGETADKAKQLLSGIQAQLQYNNRIKNDYGEKFQHGSWEEGDFTTTDGVKFLSLGFGQNPRGAREQGERPDYIVVDDVDNKKHVNNDRLMGEAIDYINEDIMGCFDSMDGGTERFVYANNNFHKNSITNRLRLHFNSIINRQNESIENDYEDEHDHIYDDENFYILHKVFRVCAVKDLVDFEPEWPEKTSSGYWRYKYNNGNTRSFLREYMHQHVEEGKVFKAKDMLKRKAMNLDKYDALCVYGDLSYKEKGDYKFLGLVGKIGKEFDIIKVYLRQKSRADVARWLYDMYEKYGWHRYAIKYLVEGLFAQSEFVNDFDKEGEKRWGEGNCIRIAPDMRGKDNKYDRIENDSGVFERHEVFFNEDDQGQDQETLIDQYLAFEKGSGANDDGPDGVNGSFRWLNTRTKKKKTTSSFGMRTSMKY